MRVLVNDIGETPRTVELVEPVAELNESFAVDDDDFRFAGDVDVDLRHYRAGEELILEGTFTAPVRGRCARCLREYPFAQQGSFLFVFKPEREGADDTDEHPGWETYTGDQIELSPFVREEILVSLPIRPLCREDCAGICSTCGADRNEEACSCRESEGDPRFAVLRELRRSMMDED